MKVIEVLGIKLYAYDGLELRGQNKEAFVALQEKNTSGQDSDLGNILFLEVPGERPHRIFGSNIHGHPALPLSNGIWMWIPKRGVWLPVEPGIAHKELERILTWVALTELPIIHTATEVRLP